MKRRASWKLAPPVVTIGVHAALIGLLVWFGVDRYEQAEIGDDTPTTFIPLPKHHPITGTTAKPAKSQRTTFNPSPTKPLMPSALPPPPMPGFTAPPPAIKRIFATSSTSGITFPSPAPKPSDKKSSDTTTSPNKFEATSPPPRKAAPTTDQGGYTSAGSVTYVRRVKPVYPAEALRKKQTGTVLLMVYVNEGGTVDRIEVIQSSGNPALDAAAVTAEKKSRFSPLMKDGQPVKFKAKVPYRFQIQ